jgi:hypothetical protein
MVRGADAGKPRADDQHAEMLGTLAGALFGGH